MMEESEKALCFSPYVMAVCPKRGQNAIRRQRKVKNSFFIDYLLIRIFLVMASSSFFKTPV